MKSIGFTFLILFFISCNAVHINYDYDKDTDYSNYGTYNYYPEMDSGLSELDTKRLLRVLDSIMYVKGIQFSEEPDFFINIQSRAFRAPQNNTVGVGVGGTGRNVGGGVSIGLPVGRPNLEREIVFDFIDSQKDMLFWQAVSESAFRQNTSPMEREEKLREIVVKVFSKYPPK